MFPMIKFGLITQCDRHITAARGPAWLIQISKLYIGFGLGLQRPDHEAIPKVSSAILW
jgi:hypothetical protein